MKKLERYKGELTFEQMVRAREKIAKNVTSLYEEATLLLKNEKLARAYFLLCIANEELGKGIIVTSAIIDLIAETIDWHRFWRVLRNHKEKTGTIEHFENVFVSSGENFTPPNLIQEIVPNLEEMKMASLYADIFQEEFFSPDEIVSPCLVKSYHELTGNRIEFFNSISVSAEALGNAKREDILAHRDKLQKMLENQ